MTEIEYDSIQFGGIKGTGVNHFLIKMWNEIMLGLEEKKSAITIMSVDFSKAFNRLQHQACLLALARRGASNQSIRMVYLFLKGRKMVVKNGFKMSAQRRVTGGSPQGTKLGNLLFCLTAEGIHEDWTVRNQLPAELSPIRETYLDERELNNTVQAAQVQASPLVAVPMIHLSLIHI